MNGKIKIVTRGCSGGHCPGYAEVDGGIIVRGRQLTEAERAQMADEPGPGETDIFVDTGIVVPAAKG